MSMQTRKTRADDLSGLKNLWSDTFSEDDRDLFFDNWFDPEHTAVITDNSEIASAGYLIPVGDITISEISGERLRCAFIYGLSTASSFRRLGCATLITNELIRIGKRLGYEMIALHPAQESLYDFYSKRTTLREWFYMREQKLEITPETTEKKELIEVSAEKYRETRSKLLSGTIHIDTDTHALNYQKALCALFGGGLYLAQTPGGPACIIAEHQSGDVVLIKELLAPEGFESYAAQAVAAARPASEYIIRTPTKGATGTSSSACEAKRFAMLTNTSGNSPPAPPCGSVILPWCGPAFD